jgi:type IV pilus assembly protein PilB
MSDVDAIRWMASEHDLEFVDLDTYGVDPAAAEILPERLSRRHHVVAIKRKFGTPVIATANPDDVSAQETVRASIGRDFISVVASHDQINGYIDQLFGPEVGGAQSGVVAIGEFQSGVDSANDPRPDEPPVDLDGEESQAPLDYQWRLADPVLERIDSRAQSPSGKRRRKDGAKRKSSSQNSDSQPEDAAALSESEPTDIVGVHEGAVSQTIEVSDVEVVVADGPDIHLDSTSNSLSEEALDSPSEEAESEASGLLFVEGGKSLSPPTNPPPEFDPSTELRDWSGSLNVLAAPDDQLAELARSVQAAEQSPVALTADLVAEAVATFEENQAEAVDTGTADQEMPTSTASFPALAQALVDGDRVSLEEMQAVLEEHDRTGQSVARILTAQKLVDEADLMWGMAQELGLEFVDLDTVGIDLTEAGTIPEATARHHNVVVIANDNGTPVVAASNPTDVFAMDDLRTIMGRNFIVVVATRTQISAYIGRAFNSGSDAADMAMEASLDFDGSASDQGVDDIEAVTEEAPIVRYVNLLVLQALNERASDIHVEPTGSELRIRYRIDGVLHDVSTAPRAISSAVTTRLKVMADMNVAEHRVPQDGRISLNVGSKGIDLRMATLPTIHGEKVVMRVLDKSSVVLGFPDLGFDPDLLTTYESLYSKPYGTILVTGPTGSGKSTTLYTTLTALNSPEKNIITVEDPVELQLKGVNQVQLNVKAGLTFASALRSILRSDPDIVLVGEIRDKETAVISIEAALTGHMVLATLHTNSAAATPMRLIEMGLEPFLVTSALSGVLAQRLARRLCVHCKEAYEPTEADIAAAGWTVQEVEAVGGMSKVYRAIGCSACANTGYRGRKALAELLPMTEEIERMIIEGGSVDDIHNLAVAQGMLTLRQSGLRKAIEGETTLEEVLRVVA